jgi:hypothetical protein
MSPKDDTSTIWHPSADPWHQDGVPSTGDPYDEDPYNPDPYAKM